MGLFRKTTEISKLLERFANGQTEIDVAEFVQLNELIQEKGQDGIVEAGKTLKGFLKHGNDEVQSKSIDLIRLLLDNGGGDIQGILSDDIGLSKTLVQTANKGEPRPRAKARDFLKSRAATNSTLNELSTQISNQPQHEISKGHEAVIDEASKYHLSEFHHDHQPYAEPGNLDGLIPAIFPTRSKQVHHEHLQQEEINTIPKLLAVGNSLVEQLKRSGPDNKISEILVDNGQTVRNVAINTIHKGDQVPDDLFKLYDNLQTAIPHAAKYIA